MMTASKCEIDDLDHDVTRDEAKSIGSALPSQSAEDKLIDASHRCGEKLIK